VVVQPAPGEMEILRSFLNTARVGAEKQEDLPSVESLSRWLATQGLLSGDVSVTEDDWRRVHGLRSALWELLVRGRTTTEEKVAQLERAAEGVSFRVAFDADGAHRFEPVAEGVSAALGGVLGVFLRARDDGRWQRLRACRNCRRVFYDRTRNLSAAGATRAAAPTSASCAPAAGARRSRSRRSGRARPAEHGPHHRRQIAGSGYPPTGASRAVKWRRWTGCSVMRKPRSSSLRFATSPATSTT